MGRIERDTAQILMAPLWGPIIDIKRLMKMLLILVKLPQFLLIAEAILDNWKFAPKFSVKNMRKGGGRREGFPSLTQVLRSLNSLVW